MIALAQDLGRYSNSYVAAIQLICMVLCFIGPIALAGDHNFVNQDWKASRRGIGKREVGHIDLRNVVLALSFFILVGWLVPTWNFLGFRPALFANVGILVVILVCLYLFSRFGKLDHPFKKIR